MTDLALHNHNFINSLPRYGLLSNLQTSPFAFNDGLLSTNTTPAVNIYETSDEYVLEANLPGWKREEVNINLENNVLTLSGNRELSEIGNRNYLRVEALPVGFSRSFTVSSAIDATNVSAEMQDGILIINLPKREETKQRQIEINAVQ